MELHFISVIRSAFFSTCCHLYMCTLFLHVLTTKLSMMKSCLPIFWIDFSATNAFFSSVERILFILDLRLEKRADFHYNLSARKKLIFSCSQISGPQTQIVSDKLGTGFGGGTHRVSMYGLLAFHNQIKYWQYIYSG